MGLSTCRTNKNKQQDKVFLNWNSFLFLLSGPSVMSISLWPHGPHHSRLPCPSLSPGACSHPCPVSWWCHPTISPTDAPSPPVLNLFQHQFILQWVGSLHQVARAHQQTLRMLPRHKDISTFAHQFCILSSKVILSSLLLCTQTLKEYSTFLLECVFWKHVFIWIQWHFSSFFSSSFSGRSMYSQIVF